MARYRLPTACCLVLVAGVAFARAPGDIDGDGVPDDADLCVAIADPAQADADGDGSGDLCDLEVVSHIPLPNVEYPFGSVAIDGALAVMSSADDWANGHATIYEHGAEGWAAAGGIAGGPYASSVGAAIAIGGGRVYVGEP